MFRLLLAYLLIIQCEYTGSNLFKESVGCSAEHNKLTAAGSSFKKTIDAGTSRMRSRGYSRSIHIDGAYSTIYLAGVASIRELYTNRSLLGDFNGQVRDIFSRINQTLVEQYCGELHDLVVITAFITNGSLDTQFTQIRREIFNERDFPTSALITISSLADPGMMVEIQAVAVMASTNKEQSIRSNSFLILMCCLYILQRFC